MKALSVRSPWPWAIFHLGKDIENRSRYCGLLGPVWIHASKWWREEEIREIWKWDVAAMAMKADPALPPPHLTAEKMDAMGAARGCLVGTVEIAGCVMSHRSPWFVGKFGFILRNPVLLEKPIPFRGSLGFFEVPDGIESWDRGLDDLAAPLLPGASSSSKVAEGATVRGLSS